MKNMTLEETQASILKSPERLRLVEAIASMTPDEFSTFVAVMEYGWARVEAGESPEAVVAEWKKEVGRV